jgi:acyl carrier protein
MDKVELRRIVVETLLKAKRQDVSAETIADDTPLGAGGLAVSSLALLQALISVEERCGFVFDDAAVAQGKFATVAELVAFIGATIGARPVLSRGVI